MVKLYSTHCNNCRTAEMLLKMNNVPFEVIDDEEVVFKVAKENNIMEMPFAEIDGVIRNFAYIRNYAVKGGK